MKIRLTNPITGKSRTYRATMTTDHAKSRYHQPVMLLDAGWCLDVANAVLQGAIIVEQPKRPDQVRMLKQWQNNAHAMIGGPDAR